MDIHTPCHLVKTCINTMCPYTVLYIYNVTQYNVTSVISINTNLLRMRLHESEQANGGFRFVIGVAPVIIHLDGIFHEINQPASWGSPMAMETPK